MIWRSSDLGERGKEAVIGSGKIEVRTQHRSGGFTLIELLVVLIILGLLAAIAGPQVLKYLGGARADAAKVSIQGLVSAVDLYRLEVGVYPTEQEGLAVLLDRPSGVDRWNGPYLRRREMVLDPWGRVYRYRFPGQHGAFDIFTLGADDLPGGTGENRDVASW
jgi:general secretion pathway protein G